MNSNKSKAPLTLEEVEAVRAGVNTRVRRFILTKTEIGRHDASGHVVDAPNWDASVVDCSSEVSAEV